MIGHNQPPLDEALAPLREKQQAMMEVGLQAVVFDDESAAKLTNFCVQVQTLIDDLKALKVETSQPYRAAIKLIDQAVDPVLDPLELLYGDRKSGMRGMLDRFVARREAAAAEERRRLADEARRLDGAAEAARQAAETARLKGRGTIGAELAASAAADAAEEAQRQADAAGRPVPIRSHLGQVGTIRSIAYDVTDLRAALGWMIRQQPIKRSLEAEVRKIIGAYLRQVGVDAVEAGVEIPGVKAWIERGASIRR